MSVYLNVLWQKFCLLQRNLLQTQSFSEKKEAKRSQEKATTVCDDTHLADEPEKEPERERKRVKLAWHNEANIFIEDPFQFSNFSK